MAKLRVFVLHGPNLNMLGTREPGIYGTVSYEQLIEQISVWSEQLDIELGYAQTNSEGALIDYVQASFGQFDLIVLNPGALTHTSYALREAIVGTGIPVIEVHISNIYAREEWRAKSLISPVCIGSICGMGLIGYRLALEAGRQLFGGDFVQAQAPVSSAAPVSAGAAPAVKLQSPLRPAASQQLTLDTSSAPPEKPASGIVAVPLKDVDQTDLANLFMPTHKYEVAQQNGPIDLGGNIGINEMMGFGEEGAESVFVGNTEPPEDDDLSPEEREKFKKWMGDDGGYDSDAGSSEDLSQFDSRDASRQQGASSSYSSSEGYPAVSGISAGMFVQGQRSSGAKMVTPISKSNSNPVKLTIPIKPKK